ncbi:hypothetical protein UFOVP1229_126 [uncultured Caudovirales phage]|uniref:Uncharacterized protein n=1 Tax=uncultured Caudovirales phage TaxID=2100421 RepID=A0A6J5R381_9CAUD|nr:hypothetical protein UFOVP1229_126 [uncultured Caudovirales phage]
MSNDSKGQGSKQPTVQELQAELKRLNDRLDGAAVKFELKEKLTRLLLRKIPRHVLYGARWEMAETFTLPEIDTVIEYMKSVLPEERALLDAYRPEFVSHREAIDNKAKLDAELADQKAKEPAPIKAPVLDVRPVNVGQAD